MLQQAGLTWPAVDKVLMVGGSTHMPMTGRMLADLTGREPDHSLAVSEVVARGAAVHAGIVRQREELIRNSGVPALELLADVVEISVNAHSLGVAVRQSGEKVNDRLIAKNTQLPAAVSRVYYTVTEDQPRVRVRRGCECGSSRARRPRRTRASRSASAGSTGCPRACRAARRSRCGAPSPPTASST